MNLAQARKRIEQEGGLSQEDAERVACCLYGSTYYGGSAASMEKAQQGHMDSPGHPIFPHNAEELRNPRRAPTEHEQEIMGVLMRFKDVPDFATLPAPTPDERADAVRRLDALLAQPLNVIGDQDDRLLELALIVADHLNIFGKSGFFMAVELVGGSKLIEQSEYRRAFFTEYEPAIPQVRAYLRELASLRRRAKEARDAEPPALRNSDTTGDRSAAAQEQMELVEAMADHQVLEKYWRMLEIVSNYRDVFTPEQFAMVAGNEKADISWRAHLAKARDEWNQYKTILRTSKIMRELSDNVIKALREVAVGNMPADAEPEPGTSDPDAPGA